MKATWKIRAERAEKICIYFLNLNRVNNTVKQNIQTFFAYNI